MTNPRLGSLQLGGGQRFHDAKALNLLPLSGVADMAELTADSFRKNQVGACRNRSCQLD
jgi:hypothetical protein